MKLRTALEVLTNEDPKYKKKIDEAVKTLQQALMQHKKEWVGLTDEESKPLIQKAMMYYGHNPDHWTLTAGAGFCILARAIEAKLKEKNNG